MLGQILRELSQVDLWLDDQVSDIYLRQPLAQDWARVSKIGEELGEAINELILLTGQNPRKEQTDNLEPLLNELADVVCTGLLAMLHFTKDDAKVGIVMVDKVRSICRRMVEHRQRRGNGSQIQPHTTLSRPPTDTGGITDAR